MCAVLRMPSETGHPTERRLALFGGVGLPAIRTPAIAAFNGSFGTRVSATSVTPTCRRVVQRHAAQCRWRGR
jgi:hypothetical protein